MRRNRPLRKRLVETNKLRTYHVCGGVRERICHRRWRRGDVEVTLDIESSENLSLRTTEVVGQTNRMTRASIQDGQRAAAGYGGRNFASTECGPQENAYREITLAGECCIGHDLVGLSDTVVEGTWRRRICGRERRLMKVGSVGFSCKTDARRFRYIFGQWPIHRNELHLFGVSTRP